MHGLPHKPTTRFVPPTHPRPLQPIPRHVGSLAQKTPLSHDVIAGGSQSAMGPVGSSTIQSMQESERRQPMYPHTHTVTTAQRTSKCFTQNTNPHSANFIRYALKNPGLLHDELVRGYNVLHPDAITQQQAKSWIAEHNTTNPESPLSIVKPQDRNREDFLRYVRENSHFSQREAVQHYQEQHPDALDEAQTSRWINNYNLANRDNPIIMAKHRDRIRDNFLNYVQQNQHLALSEIMSSYNLMHSTTIDEHHATGWIKNYNGNHRNSPIRLPHILPQPKTRDNSLEHALESVHIAQGNNDDEAQPNTAAETRLRWWLGGQNQPRATTPQQHPERESFLCYAQSHTHLTARDAVAQYNTERPGSDLNLRNVQNWIASHNRSNPQQQINLPKR